MIRSANAAIVAHRIFGFLLGATATGASFYYYVLSEYKVSNELLTEDIYVCYVHLTFERHCAKTDVVGAASCRPTIRGLRKDNRREDSGLIEEKIAGDDDKKWIYPMGRLLLQNKCSDVSRCGRVRADLTRW
jgi:hypothetical protein